MRVPPHNIEAEESVLGSMLLSREAIADVFELLNEDDFYRPGHRTVFAACLALYGRGEPVDAVSVATELGRGGQLADVGGGPFLHTLIAGVPTAANAAYYAGIVREAATLRRLIDTGTRIVQLGYDTSRDVDVAVDAAEQLIYQVAQGRVSEEYQSLRDVLKAALDTVERLHEDRREVTGVDTGFPEFNRLTAGLQPSNLIIVAARPAVGKSTFALDIARHASVRAQVPTVIFSLEMSKTELVQRLMCAECSVDMQKLRTGRLDDSDWQRLTRSLGRLADAPLYIDDSASTTMMEIRAKCRRLRQRQGLGLVIVDYLQLMQPPRRSENRQQEVSEISRSMKLLAKELDVPVIAVSQLSRQPESRSDRRPLLSDLRESGCLTGDARVLLADGTTRSIGTLAAHGDRDVEVWAIDEHQRPVIARLRRAFPTGERLVWRLALESGHVVTGTANHPVWTRGGWLPLGACRPGMRVATLGPADAPDAALSFRPWARGAQTAQGACDPEVSNWAEGGPLTLAPPRPRSAFRSRLHAQASGGLAPRRVRGGTTLSNVKPYRNLIWGVVAAVDPRGTQPVFDATVPDVHNFVAEGIVVHNSLEQDADMVVFIYRDELYDPESPRRGEADLIVAKHRNGPTDTVVVTFQGQYSRFAPMARG